MAFACNSTRVATLQAGDGTDQTGYIERLAWVSHRIRSNGSNGTAISDALEWHIAIDRLRMDTVHGLRQSTAGVIDGMLGEVQLRPPFSMAGAQSQPGCESSSRNCAIAWKVGWFSWRGVWRACQAVCVALRGSAWLCVLGVLGLGPPALAADTSVPIHLLLSGADDCSSLRELLASIQKRNGRVRLAAGDEAASTVTFRVWYANAGFTGELSVRGVDGSSSTREVSGDSCVGVLETLALTASLALQSAWEQHDERKASEATKALAVPEPPKSLEAPKAGKSAASGGSRLQVEAGAQAALARVVAPHLNVGGGVLARARWQRDELFSPSVSISAVHTRNELFESSRHAAMRVTGVSVALCPIALRPHRRLRVEPCWMTTGAQLQALGRELDSEQSVSRSWWATGALARLAFEPSPRFAFELEGGALLPLVDRRFVALPSRTLLGSTPAIAPIATAGVVYAL